MESIELHALGKDIFARFSQLSGVQDVASHSFAKRLISEEQRFRLWAHSLGLHNHGHSSLDYRVRDAMAVKSRLSEILVELKEQLENLVAVQSGDREPFENAAAPTLDAEGNASDRDSDARSMDTSSMSPSVSSDGESFHEVDFRVKSIEEAVDALYSLATKIKNPRNRPQRTMDELYKHVPAQVRKKVILEGEEAAIAIVCHIQQQELLMGLQDGQLSDLGMKQHDILGRYASPSNWLVRRAGIANARRKQQFVYWKEHADRIIRGPSSSAPPPRLEKRRENDIAAADKEQPLEQGGHIPTWLDDGGNMTRSLATSETRLDETFIKLDDLRSVISQQSRVSTVINLRGEHLNWPSPPVQITSSSFFTCPYCKIICPGKYLAKDAWRVHLIHDLQPYHCTFEHCNDANRIYGTRQEWLGHEALHTRVWHCSIHGEEFKMKQEYTAHLLEQHPEHSAEQVSSELIDAALGPSTSLQRGCCPFCPTTFSEAGGLQKHITYHLERLAILALPAYDNNGMEDSERASDSHEGQRRGRKGSAEIDFTDEEQRLFVDSFRSAASEQPRLRTSLVDIQQAVIRREEDTLLTKWLADSEEADSIQSTDETMEQRQQQLSRLEKLERELELERKMERLRRMGNHFTVDYESEEEPEAPTKEHFPYLPSRSVEENFQYRPGLSNTVFSS